MEQPINKDFVNKIEQICKRNVLNSANLKDVNLARKIFQVEQELPIHLHYSKKLNFELVEFLN